MTLHIAGASVIGDALGGVPWFEAFQGLNVLINFGLIAMDIKKFWELNKMRETWNKGKQARREMLEENPYFENEKSVKDVIFEIREKIVRQDY